MKRLYFSLALLLFSSVSFAQNYKADSGAAWAIYQTGDYRAALDAYKQLEQQYNEIIDSEDVFIAACCASLVEQADTAFLYLERSLDGGSWRYALSDGDLTFLQSDPRWEGIKSKVQALEQAYIQELRTASSSISQHNIWDSFQPDDRKGENLYQYLRNYTPYVAPQNKSVQYLSFWFAIDDTTHAPYLVQLPPNYDPKRAYPCLLFLHGAVRHISEFDAFSDADAAGGWNRFFSKNAIERDVIMVYPTANKDYNWLTPDDGFFLVPAIVQKLKQHLHIADDKVFVAGHSNGASGAFSYAVKNPNVFAGYYGMNTHPKVYTGGTFLKNLRNSYFFNIATDQDYYFTVSGNDTLQKYGERYGFEYKTNLYKGFPHWFPQFDESEPAVISIFDHLATRRKQPFQNELYWECDDVQHGRCHWLEITALDTLQEVEDWHERINFEVQDWVDVEKPDSILAHVEPAFDFPRASGAVQARYANNRFDIETSKVGKIKLYFSPEMIDFKERVQIYINGKRYFRKKIRYNEAFMLQNFRTNLDRQAVWCAVLELEI